MSWSKYKEVEVKYKIKPEQLFQIKEMMEKHNSDFLYVESKDDYYTNKKNEFIRHRYSESKKERRAELTIKRKLDDNNNIFRKEVNLRVDNSTPDLVKNFVNLLGYKFNFTLNKWVHVYHLSEAIVACYTVKTNGKLDHFLEIEVNEDLEITKEEAWEIIRKWEREFEVLDLKPQNRLRLSLFENYVKSLDSQIKIV